VKAKKFLQTTLIGGLVAILPLGLLIIVVRWLFILIIDNLKPVVDLVQPNTKLSLIMTYAIALGAIIILFFIVGLIIRTRFGSMVSKYLENTYLMKIPGYKTARDIVKSFMGNKSSFFSEVVLVDVFDNATLMTGFITDRYEDFVTVFVPNGPNPTTGFIYHVPWNKVIKSNTPVETAFKSIISCGAGSAVVLGNREDKPESASSI
jgi:uncharacterized membrane protein